MSTPRPELGNCSPTGSCPLRATHHAENPHCVDWRQCVHKEGVAAPLEPTQDRLNFRANLEHDWMSQQTIMDFSNWLVEQLWVSQHGKIKADSMYLAFCGGRPTGEVIDWKAWERVANCANQSAAAVSKNLQEELARAEDYLDGRECARCGGKVSGSNWKAAQRYMEAQNVRCVGCHGAAGAWRPYGIMGLQARILELESEITAPDWLTIAAMLCLNFEMKNDGQDALPSELAKYMADIHKQILDGKTPR